MILGSELGSEPVRNGFLAGDSSGSCLLGALTRSAQNVAVCGVFRDSWWEANRNEPNRMSLQTVGCPAGWVADWVASPLPVWVASSEFPHRAANHAAPAAPAPMVAA